MPEKHEKDIHQLLSFTLMIIMIMKKNVFRHIEQSQQYSLGKDLITLYSQHTQVQQEFL